MMSLSNSLNPLSYSSGNSEDVDKNTVKILKAPDFISRTLSPMVTVSSVIGLKFQNGVAIATDMSGFYGSLNRYQDLERVYEVNNSIVMACTGDFADFQYMKDLVQQKIISEEILDDKFSMKAFSLHTWLTRLMYNRRSKFDPLWNNVVVAGFDATQGPFLGVVDKLGLSYEDATVTTGMGSYLVNPYLRDVVEKAKGNMTKQQAQQALIKGLEILFYRSTQSSSKYRIAFVTSEGVEIMPTNEVLGSWEIGSYVKSY